ncbi:NADH:ubiquinone reductase (Na(+)-transporting) subunit E [Estrella lausannensis]|uniref:Na(+)-translocating NADH-quinone reductase subunit E n=1 Tax=Estrella lausannensis TaxID=483423 RepID=A0A0H5DN77_9BACT|nr:NADH:ubiquinone reductase (Na(+)-transporting) subunit E [Estrella lausannensis]CRX37721.1 Na(+)-translocating NADH-quinone reductase subunit E [Estrella lausannensis]
MWMGSYEPINLLGLLIQSVLIENFLLANFLGMCTYLACSTKLKTANGLGVAVVFVLTCSGVLNWFVHQFITKAGGLAWLDFIGLDASAINLNFLEFLLFISVIAAFVQMLEIVLEKVSPALYLTLGIYLPLIAVNCAILGACLFAVTRDYPFVPNLVYVFGSGAGWWLAIALIAAIREKLVVSDVVPSLRGMAITFIMTGLMSMAFQGFTGIKLAVPTGVSESVIDFAAMEDEKPAKGVQ